MICPPKKSCEQEIKEQYELKSRCFVEKKLSDNFSRIYDIRLLFQAVLIRVFDS